MPGTHSSGASRRERSTTTTASSANQPFVTNPVSMSPMTGSGMAYGGSAKITSYGSSGGARIRLDQQYPRRTPGRRLDADRPGAGVQIEEAGPVQVDHRVEGTEQRLTYPVGGGPGAPARRHGQPPPTELAGDDAAHPVRS